MKVFSEQQAHQNLAELLDCALADGEVHILRSDGQAYRVIPMPKEPTKSPLDIAPGAFTLGQAPMSADEIVALVRESREHPRGEPDGQ